MLWVKYKHDTRASAGKPRYKHVPDSFKETVEDVYKGNVAEAMVEEGFYKEYMGESHRLEAEFVDLAEVPEEAIESWVQHAAYKKKYFTDLHKELKGELLLKRLSGIEGVNITPVSDQNVMLDP